MNTLYAGIDLHSNNSVLVISNESDVVVYEKRVKNDIDAISKALRPYAKALAGKPRENQGTQELRDRL